MRSGKFSVRVTCPLPVADVLIDGIGYGTETIICQYWGIRSVILGVSRWSRVKDGADMGVRTVCIG